MSDTQTRFADMLDRKAEEIQRPPLIPIGQYLLQVKAQPEPGELTGNDGTLYDKLGFQLVVVSAEEVDEEELAEFGKIEGSPVRHDFLFNTSPDEGNKREGTLNRLKMFLEHCGVFEEGMTLQEALAQSPGTQVMGEIGHRADKNDPDLFHVEIKRTYQPD